LPGVLKKLCASDMQTRFRKIKSTFEPRPRVLCVADHPSTVPVHPSLSSLSSSLSFAQHLTVSLPHSTYPSLLSLLAQHLVPNRLSPSQSLPPDPTLLPASLPSRRRRLRSQGRRPDLRSRAKPRSETRSETSLFHEVPRETPPPSCASGATRTSRRERRRRAAGAVPDLAAATAHPWGPPGSTSPRCQRGSTRGCSTP
jgi:hypothetical protein